MPNPFSLEQFIRNSGEKNFTMEVVENQENYLEMEIKTTTPPVSTFNVYIERDVIFGKTALDGFRKHFGGMMGKKPKRFDVKNLYKEMKK